jgi:hypothetical protein
MANPLIDQGVLNRLRGSVVIPNLPNLNVTAPYLGKPGIRLSLTGETATGYPTMTGVVQSPEPFQVAEVTVSLLRTQGLADLYKQQMELNVLLGPIKVYPDVTAGGISSYYFENVTIASVGEQSFAGDDPAFGIMLRGQYYLNSALWTA